MNSVITYSPAYTIVPTYECFNRCSYCNFRMDLGKGTDLSETEAINRLQKLDVGAIAEILVVSGEVHPKSNERDKWFARIQNICSLSLSCGFLPHTNVGPLNWMEMEQLKQVNVSMGLMLEQLNPKFRQTVHKHAPSKEPELRLQQLSWAGQQKIPFTTGLLLGIGETESDIKQSLTAIADVHHRWGHIQEVILQPHSVGTRQESDLPTFPPEQLPKIIAMAKKILPDEIAIQIPPNLLARPDLLLKCLDAGATDLGGISPIDEVNPDYPHPTYKSLQKILQPAGWTLQPRLPVYPQYYSWLSPTLQKAIADKKKALIWKI